MVDPIVCEVAERRRLEEAYQRRQGMIAPDRYPPWQPGALFLDAGRRRSAARLLHRAGVFPGEGDACLEVGFGTLGWLAQLIEWGVREDDLHGLELQEDRVEAARRLLPNADLRAGDAGSLPWADGSFRLVVASMVFTAIPRPEARRKAADEVIRVLAPGGALLWYDIAVNNPWNPLFRKVTRSELAVLFPGLRGEVRSANLPPPLARRVAPVSWTLATLMEAIPPLRPFLVAVLVKPGVP